MSLITRTFVNIFCLIFIEIVLNSDVAHKAGFLRSALGVHLTLNLSSPSACRTLGKNCHKFYNFR